MRGLALLPSVDTIRVAQPAEERVCCGDTDITLPENEWAVTVEQVTRSGPDSRTWLSFQEAQRLSHVLSAVTLAKGKRQVPLELDADEVRLDWPRLDTYCIVCAQGLDRHEAGLSLRQLDTDDHPIAQVWVHVDCVATLAEALSVAWAYKRQLH